MHLKLTTVLLIILAQILAYVFELHYYYIEELKEELWKIFKDAHKVANFLVGVNLELLFTCILVFDSKINRMRQISFKIRFHKFVKTAVALQMSCEPDTELPSRSISNVRGSFVHSEIAVGTSRVGYFLLRDISYFNSLHKH